MSRDSRRGEFFGRGIIGFFVDDISDTEVAVDLSRLGFSL